MVTCPTCGDELKTEDGMKSHHKQAHGESLVNTSVECEVCGEEKEVRKSYEKKIFPVLL